ncbi:MAG: ABC transporter ATP-binding protein [Meiothermus sp.]|nr:ABC transporter ATP-binding protein [Meiothermus sp.]
MVDKLWKIYRHSKEFALKGISITLPGGQNYGLLGPNGSGKTTLSRLLVGLLRPTKGRIIVNGVLLNNTGRHPVPVGYVPQVVPYFPGLTGRDLLEFALTAHGFRGPALRRAREEVVELLGIGALQQKLIWHMSGGEARITLVATALAFRPPLLVLDEPSAGLDALNRQRLWESLTHYKKNYHPTMLLVTHDIQEAETVLDEALILSEGELVARGTIPELRRRHSPMLVCTVVADHLPFHATEWREAGPGRFQRLVTPEQVPAVMDELKKALGTGAAEVSVRAATLEEIVFSSMEQQV